MGESQVSERRSGEELTLSEGYSLDRIILSQLKLDLHIGFGEHERGARQPVCISVELCADCSPAAISRSLSEGISYSDIRKQILAIASRQDWTLLEELTHTLCDELLNSFPTASSVKVFAQKFVYSDAAWVGIESLKTR